MIKNILIKCAELTNRDDIVDELKAVSNVDEINNKNIQNDIYRLISYYNFIVSNLFENYFEMKNVEVVLSNENGDIFYDNLIYAPININSVKNGNKDFSYEIHTTKISTSLPNELFEINYNYKPKEACNLTDKLNIPSFLSERIVCYGVVSEFLASKDQFDKSEFWKNKFLYEIFKIKVKKERRFKSTF